MQHLSKTAAVVGVQSDTFGLKLMRFNSRAAAVAYMNEADEVETDEKVFVSHLLPADRVKWAEATCAGAAKLPSVGKADPLSRPASTKPAAEVEREMLQTIIQIAEVAGVSRTLVQMLQDVADLNGVSDQHVATAAKLVTLQVAADAKAAVQLPLTIDPTVAARRAAVRSSIKPFGAK